MQTFKERVFYDMLFIFSLIDKHADSRWTDHQLYSPMIGLLGAHTSTRFSLDLTQ